MFDRRHYVPVLKWKQGEYRALRELSATDKTLLTPIIEIVPVPGDDEDAVADAAVDQHIARVPDQMATHWGGAHRIFVDLGLIQEGALTTAGQQPVDRLFQLLAVSGVQAVPVTGPDRDAAYNVAVRAVAQRDGRGVCVRLSAAEAFDGAPGAGIGELLEMLGLQRADVDLVLDFSAIDPSQANLVRTGAVGLLAALPQIEAYRTLTMVSGAFPLNLSHIPGGTVGVIPRSDWTTWLGVMMATVPRVPTYGDYTAAHPVLPFIDPVVMQMSASIRYCSDAEWIVYRGFSVRNPNKGGYGQFQTLSAALAADSVYAGPNFSGGDAFINACAQGGPTGNAAKWRQVATNRHLVCALRQIASLS